MEGLSRNALLLGELIEDLLLVSTLDEKKIRLDWITYQPSQILQDILQQLEPRQRAKELTIEYEVDENIKLHGDPKRIGQVFRVIIDNAIKYSGDRTKIMVKAIDHYIGKYNPQNIDGMLIQFSDSGRGIRQQDIPYLFERFFRSEEVQTIPGTGLGLSIARNLVQLHQGEIYVESVYGKGSTFFVFLPRIERPPQI
jgi:signal transduction histidine kinase